MLNPFMLLGLLGLGIPIAIHLIQKQRLKPQSLATLRFLDMEDVANAFHPIPRDILQLILRLLFLTIMIILLGRLTVPTSHEAPKTMIIILDQSMSMQQNTSKNQMLYKKMKSEVAELIDVMGENDQISLHLVGDKVKSSGFLDDRDKLLDFLADSEVSDSGGLALMPTIRQSVNLLRSRHEVNPIVIVFSDHQLLNYSAYLKEDEKQETEKFKKHLTNSGVKLIFIDPQSSITNNIAIEQAVFSKSETYLGSSAAMTVTARNYGTESKTVNLMFYEGTTEGGTRELTLESGETAHMDLIHSFENPVDVVCKVTIDEDSLPGDNKFFIPMRMKNRTQILLVSQAEDEKQEDRNFYKGSDLLAYALNPGEALGTGGGTYISVKRITPNVLDKQALPIYSMIVLYGVANLTEQSQKDLQVYVRNGGGLMIILESGMSPFAINNGLSAFFGGTTLTQLKDSDKITTININESMLDDDVLFPLLHGEWGELSSVTINKYFGLETTGNANVLLRTAEGDPLIVKVPLGKGNVIIQAFDCELGSSSLPRTSAFVPVCHELFQLLTGGDIEKETETMRAGDELRIKTPEFRNLSGDVHVDGPDSFKIPITDGDSIRFNQAVKAGAYQLSHPLKQSGRKHWVTVNPVQGESDVTALEPKAMKELFGEKLQLIPYSEVSNQFVNKREIINLMLLLLFTAFTIEALIGAWGSRSKRQMEGN